MALALMISLLQATTYTTDEAAAHVGEYAQVCGVVSSGHYAKSSKGRPTFLNLDGHYPDQKFTIVIWGDDRYKFKSPEHRFKHQKICVRGLIESFKGKPQIILKEKEQLGRGK
jgi:hypothetical protein